MSSPSFQHAMPRSRRSVLPRLLALTVPLALAACGGSDTPLAPTDPPPASVGEALTPTDSPPAGGLAASDLALAATSQRIAFTSYRNGNQPDIYKMDPQGYNVVRLTGSTTNEVGAAWSWDNKHIAMVRSRLDANKVLHDDIYVIDSDGSHGHWARSTPFPYFLSDPSWSPDGSRLLLTVTVQSNAYIGWMDLATGQVGIFNHAGYYYWGRQPSYDPTGKWIVYIGAGNRTVDRITADASIHLGVVACPVQCGHPSYSPGGTKIAFDQLVNGNMDIYVKSLATSVTTRVTTNGSTDTEPTWSPDGSRLAFASSRSGQYQIYTINAGGGTPTRITHTATGEVGPAWSH